MSKNKFLDLMVLVEDQVWYENYGNISNISGRSPLCEILRIVTNGKSTWFSSDIPAWYEFTSEFPDSDLDEFIQVEEMYKACTFSPSNNPLHRQLVHVLINAKK